MTSEMSVTSDARPAAATFHPIRVSRVITETAEARSFVLDIPAELAATFSYRAGQFVTLRAVIGGERYLRSYSMSSAPQIDAAMQITVKRTAGGVVSNWLLDTVVPGDILDVSAPAGRFVLGDSAGELVTFAAGSGITPVFSLLKSALGRTPRRVHLLYANRDTDSVIFDAELAALTERHPDCFRLTHHLDDARGLLTEQHVRDAVQGALSQETDAHYYVCGPAPFMDVVDGALRSQGVPAERVHIERFTPPEPPEEIAAGRPDKVADGHADRPGPVALTMELAGRSATVTPRAGATILQSARSAGLKAPSSCETGSCATCLARLVGGEAPMRNNEVLTPEELAEGWVLTCQAVPASPTVHVIYE